MWSYLMSFCYDIDKKKKISSQPGPLSVSPHFCMGELACLNYPSLSVCRECTLRWKGVLPGWVPALGSELLGQVLPTHNLEL